MPTVEGNEIPTGDEINWYLGVAITAEAVGTGDAIETVFELDNQSIDYEETIYVATVAQVRGTDYTADYTGGTGGVTAITFTAAPAVGDAITADYDQAIEFAASSAGKVDFDQDVLERTVHGSTTKLKKTGAGSAKASLTDVLIDGEILQRFLGAVTADSPITGKSQYKWSGAAVKTIPWVIGRVLRTGSMILLLKLKNVALSAGSLAFPEGDFFENAMDWEIDDFEMIYDTPT